MAKRRTLATRAFGGEPGLPDIAGLAEWIAEHRGRIADIVTYRLERSLAPQITAGIGLTCAGGRFYGDRIFQCLAGVTDKRATGEIHADTPAIIEDAAGIVVQAKGAWCAMPAPHELGITHSHYDDDDEWSTAICDAYSTILRAMRDTGVAGHVLIADRMDEAELAALARQKVFFFSPSPDRDTLAMLLEHQQQVAAGKDQLATVFDLTAEYTLRRIYLTDPDPASISLALSHLDPDQIVAAGYDAEGDGDYWKEIVSHAIYSG
ncbi:MULTISPECIES: hypothetical protein [unclassified Methanoregula]|uniref:hypothetical protein n=1 Tax=unclassified Methanoregula TaxID=2649730 RepID=UPI0009D21CFF|nr:MULTISPECIES: hypothetical protein [unclassified Methanoregula]OPX63654.1 MAG: hypothetical protein A4E33_01590 [Methanoregula sp. PtaB.Bin085]OPY36179.1 MAG: hypothetical protein A4E34_00356 [Methanoregula sp. PtaU1.Bin006]